MSEKQESITAKGNEITVLKELSVPKLHKNTTSCQFPVDDASEDEELLSLNLSHKDMTDENLIQAQHSKKKGKVPAEEIKRDGRSKTELNKIRKRAEKEAKRAVVRAERAEQPNQFSSSFTDESIHLYGDFPLMCSKSISNKTYVQINKLSAASLGQSCWTRCRVGAKRVIGKGCFLLLCQNIFSMQSVAWQSPVVSKSMLKYIGGISIESIVDVFAEVKSAETEISSASVKMFELFIKEIHVVSRASDVPFTTEDASRRYDDAASRGCPFVSQDVRLNYRWVDTRTSANQAIFRIQSGVCQLFREYLIAKDFVEIHTPKLIGGSTEGRSNVFQLKYFEQNACLAQSPQLYKQMTAACGGFERVFEIGPGFRADNRTFSHLCEFTGLDFEMAINQHYFEALEVMDEMFMHIFDGLNARYRHELQLFSQQHPYEPMQYPRTALRITFQEGIELLKTAGYEGDSEYGLCPLQERALGDIVKEKYGTDVYIMDKNPSSTQCFCTMPDPDNKALSNSFYVYIRGVEVLSGAQGIHSPELLVERAAACGIPIPSIQSYVDAFKHGALPHAGGGIGLERLVMQFLGLNNIREAAMYPRGRHRLAP